MNMQVLKRSRTPPLAGGIFAYRLKGHPFGFGRVIRLGTKIGGFEDVLLIYIFRAFSMDKNAIPELTKRDLLIPPLGINRRPWTMGYFETVAHRALENRDVLSVHCFRDEIAERYCDEFGKTLPRRREPCGFFGLESFRTLDVELSIALGVPPSPDTLPP